MSKINEILQENIRITAQVITEICQRNTRKQVSDFPLTRNQCYILKILHTSGEFLISELARILEISPAAASKIIDRLEQMELVARQPHEGDRRSFEVKLLDKGRQLVEKINQVTNKKLVPLMSQFSKEEKVQLLDFLQRIVKYTLADENNTDLICLQCGGKCGSSCAVETVEGICSRPKKK
jgi:MarR family transcriptional regulator, organic hydroperoxide resistance regulator